MNKLEVLSNTLEYQGSTYKIKNINNIDIKKITKELDSNTKTYILFAIIFIIASIWLHSLIIIAFAGFFSVSSIFKIHNYKKTKKYSILTILFTSNTELKIETNNDLADEIKEFLKTKLNNPDNNSNRAFILEQIK